MFNDSKIKSQSTPKIIKKDASTNSKTNLTAKLDNNLKDGSYAVSKRMEELEKLNKQLKDN